MPSAKAVKLWYLVHKWTSLACTAFLLLLCLTGLPLIFEDEINALSEPPVIPSPRDEIAAAVDLDLILANAKDRYPGDVVQFVIWDEDAPRLSVVMASTLDAPLKQRHLLAYDLRNGALLHEQTTDNAFMAAVLALHSELFAGLPGTLLIGVMGLLFLAAIVSGVALYAPFMRRLDFGTVRRGRSVRIRWLDLHNLLGIAITGWIFIVGATGVLNTLTDPLFDAWRERAVSDLLAPYLGKPPPMEQSGGQSGSLQRAVAAVHVALPGMKPTGAIFPDVPFGAPGHYMIWTQGQTPLTAHLLTPALADAETGQVSAVATLPWHLKLLELSRPLHFGDYGGLPLKIVWALLDLAAIALLGSGVYLWLSRRKSPLETRLAEIETGGTA